MTAFESCIWAGVAGWLDQVGIRLFQPSIKLKLKLKQSLAIQGKPHPKKLDTRVLHIIAYLTENIARDMSKEAREMMDR